MTKTTTASMFESIKGALDKASKSSYGELLKLEPGKTYQVRLLPNTKNPEDTFYHYFHHGWNSKKSGQYVSAICPSTWGGRSPISEEYFKLYREAGNDKHAQDIAKLLKRKESWYVNVYVIDDPTKTENKGKVKILRFGKQIMKIIENAISGEDSEEFGPKIFELGPEGCTFRIKPEKKSEKGNADFAIEYTSSKFLQPKEIPGLDEEKITEVLNSLHDLSKIDETKPEAELVKMLKVHFYGEDDNTSDNSSNESGSKSSNNALAAAAASAKNKKVVKESSAEPEDDIDMTPAKSSPPVAVKKNETKSDSKSNTVDIDDTDGIDALLDGLK